LKIHHQRPRHHGKGVTQPEKDPQIGGIGGQLRLALEVNVTGLMVVS
jgi:hypothetical protein